VGVTEAVEVDTGAIAEAVEAAAAEAAEMGIGFALTLGPFVFIFCC